ncbi:MAG: hypothetical protein KatS3mg023_3229 [Armatimonadota bacterium]|nr:MAG: hypothetical protein KatS3mg023_3229 [Armatimonadota bacterium]
MQSAPVSPKTRLTYEAVPAVVKVASEGSVEKFLEYKRSVPTLQAVRPLTNAHK